MTPYLRTSVRPSFRFPPFFVVSPACKFLSEDLTSNDQTDEFLSALSEFAGVYYNNTGTQSCFQLSAPVNNESQIINTLWNYQYCSQIFQMLGQEPGENDIFWSAPWNGDEAAEGCFQTYGFHPNRNHFALAYGSPSDWARTSSNIIWSQGEYDPWKGGGVVEDLSDSLRAVIIPEVSTN